MNRIRTCTLVLVTLVVSDSMAAWALKCHANLAPIKIEARPGQTVNRSLQLTLTPDEQRTQFKVHAEDWWRSEDGQQSFYREPGTLSRSCAPWIKLNPVEAAVDPGGTLDVRVTVAVPKDVKPGGYWCVLTLDEVPDPLKIRPDGVGIRFLASISVGLFVYVAPVERAARVVDVKLLPEQALVKLRNDGNCPLGVEGRFEFIPTGETKPVAIARFTRTTVLPEPINTAVLMAALPDSKLLPSGRYLVRAILDIGLDHYIGVQKEMEITRGIAPAVPAASGSK